MIKVTEPTEEMLIAGMKEEGSYAEPYEPDYEEGVEMSCGMNQDDCDLVNRETKKSLAKIYKAMRALEPEPARDDPTMHQWQVAQDMYNSRGCSHWGSVRKIIEAFVAAAPAEPARDAVLEAAELRQLLGAAIIRLQELGETTFTLPALKSSREPYPGEIDEYMRLAHAESVRALKSAEQPACPQKDLPAETKPSMLRCSKHGGYGFTRDCPTCKQEAIDNTLAVRIAKGTKDKLLKKRSPAETSDNELVNAGSVPLMKEMAHPHNCMDHALNAMALSMGCVKRTAAEQGGQTTRRSDSQESPTAEPAPSAALLTGEEINFIWHDNCCAGDAVKNVFAQAKRAIVQQAELATVQAENEILREQNFAMNKTISEQQAELAKARERNREHEQFRAQHKDCDLMAVENQRLKAALKTCERDALERAAKGCDNQRHPQHSEIANWMAANCAAVIRTMIAKE